MNGDALEELLVREGWPIGEDQLSDFIGEPISKIQDADMREYALPVLSNRINKQLGEFKGPLIVQVLKPRNVSYPKYSEGTHNDGLIKIQLTDGFSSIHALLFEPIPKLNAGTPPGTKVLLIGKIPIENGMLLINGTNCQVLGGNVEKMVEKWNLEKNWLQKPIRTSEGNALKWVQFSKQRSSQSSLPLNATDKWIEQKMTDEHDDDFSAARKAQIEQVVENNAIKKFARSQLKPKSLENSASTSWNNSNKKDPVIKAKPDMENKNRRFVRDDKRNLSTVHRPSNPSTLYDFMQPKVSVINEPSGQRDHGRDQMRRTDANVQNVEIQGLDHSRKNRFNVKGFRNRQIPESNTGSRTIEISNSNRYRKQFNRSERQRNCATDTMGERSRSDYTNDDQSITTANKQLMALHLSSVNNGSNGEKDRNIPQSTVFFENRNRNYQQNTICRSTYEQREQQAFNDVIMNGGIPVWKIGDKCLAPWSDGQFYPSTLISMGPADMCTIEYDEYGNRSSVPVGVLLPLQTF
ncbi:hypothetical protein DINM_005948 [Dirofilaria immitis]|nr:hypothetical protein [Dirofilaria immitis]